MKAIFNILPVPASRARVTRWSTYFPKRYSDFKKEMKILLDDIHIAPTDSLLSVKMEFYIPMPKAWSKKKKKERLNTYCDNNADIDNYVKAILDSLEGKYFDNDKQIVEVTHLRKIYSEEPCIVYVQEEINNGNVQDRLV